MDTLIKSLIGEKTIAEAIQESSARIQEESRTQSIKIYELNNDHGFITGSIFPTEKIIGWHQQDNQ